MGVLCDISVPDFDDVRLTRHARQDKPVKNDKIRELLMDREGQLYFDTQSERYLLVSGLTVVVFDVQDGEAVAITAFHNTQPGRYTRKRRYRPMNWGENR